MYPATPARYLRAQYPREWRHRARAGRRSIADDFVAFSVLFGKPFAKTASSVTRSAKADDGTFSACLGSVIRTTTDSTVGSFCSWRAISPQLRHHSMSERCFLLLFASPRCLACSCCTHGARSASVRSPGGAWLI